MAQAPILYQETHTSPTPSLQSQILHINTSGEAQTPSLFGAGRKRPYDEYADLDEDTYARKYLATEGSVYFRRKSRAPRTFLWRVLDDRKVVEVQAVDLVHDDATTAARSESCLTFHLRFEGGVMRHGVAFADPEESDALEVFVLTESKELWTVILKRDLLTRDAVPSEFETKTVCRKYSSTSLSFRQPFKLVAASSLELLISLTDRRMVRLERQPNETGSQWRETLFSEGGWTGTLRGMIPGQKQWVKYGDLDLDASTIAAMAKSPDGKYIWTVTLDHVLRAWSSQSAQAFAKQDLLCERQTEEGSKRQPKYVMGAEQGTLLQVVVPPPPPPTTKKGKAVVKMDTDEGDGKYYIVVHSPKDHQFKFYEVTPKYSSAEGADFELDDLQPMGKLIPPIDKLLNTNVWHLEDFFLQPGPNWNGTQLWLRARSGTLCKTYMLTFDLFVDSGDTSDLQSYWNNEWVAVDAGIRTAEAIKGYVDYPGELEEFGEDATSPNERWIDFLFTPGRFSIASIESALHIYSQGRNLQPKRTSKSLKPSQEPLQERLVRAITSKILLPRLPNDQPNFAKYNADVQEQWKMFFSLLSHLHTRRHDSIGFAFDTDDALPWSICADFVAPVCETSHFDNLILNNGLLKKEVMEETDAVLFRRVFSDDDSAIQSRLLKMMKGFRERLSAEFQLHFKDFVVNGALSHVSEGREHSAARLQAIYEANKVHENVLDDDFEALEAAADGVGGLGGITDDAILSVLELLGEEKEGLHKQKRQIIRFGDRFMVAAAQEILEKDQSTLLDVLLLVVFMYGDLGQEDLNEGFMAEIGPIYDAIMMRIKHNALLTWLATNEIPEDEESGGLKAAAEIPNVNLLLRCTITDLDPRSRGHETMPELLTLWSRSWVYDPMSNLHQDWDGFTGHILGFLLKLKHLDLATKLQKFLTPAENASGWIKYLTGRLALASGDYVGASLKFRDAADDMAEASHIATADSSSLLSAVERNYFGVGHASFFQHVTALYEHLKIWSYTADFAALALKHLKNDFDQARRSKGARQITHANLKASTSAQDSPEVRMIDDVTDEIGYHLSSLPIRDELAGRLFNALVQTGRFRAAFDALTEIDNLNVKKANLKELVAKCVKASPSAVPDLLALPFEAANLTQEADSILYALAKKSLASTGSSGSPAYYRILYAFRTQRSDFRGAAVILYEHLQRMIQASKELGIVDPEDETLLEAYVLLINTLACCGKEDAWLLADPLEAAGKGAGSTPSGKPSGEKRKLITVEEVRKEYAAELDRRSDVLHGRFPLVAGDAMDVF